MLPFCVFCRHLACITSCILPLFRCTTPMSPNFRIPKSLQQFQMNDWRFKCLALLLHQTQQSKFRFRELIYSHCIVPALEIGPPTTHATTIIRRNWETCPLAHMRSRRNFRTTSMQSFTRLEFPRSRFNPQCSLGRGPAAAPRKHPFHDVYMRRRQQPMGPVYIFTCM